MKHPSDPEMPEDGASGPTPDATPAPGPASATGLASAEDLDRLLAGAQLESDDLVRILRSRHVTVDHLQRIGATPRWLRSRQVKRLLVQHPRCPLPLARRLMPQLYWTELAETSDNPRLHPSVRKQAERLLEVRQQELTLGERISLARRATRGLFSALLSDGETRIVQGLLHNPRMVESDAVDVARGEAPREALRELARHPRWRASRAVQLALLENPATPPQVALQVVRQLPASDLRQIVQNDKVSKLVRVGARRSLEDRAERARTADGSRGRARG